MSSKTDDLDKAIRIIADRFKSFPRAVAEVVREMFDRGAERVRIFFETVRGEPLLTLHVENEVFSHDERKAWCDATDLASLPTWLSAYVHHGRECELTWLTYTIKGLGMGEGVNPRQDRSAKRLVRALPALLSPHEAYRTVVVDENGSRHALLNEPPAASMANGFEVSIPEKFIWVGGNGLVIKFGAVRVPVGKLLGATAPMEDRRLDSLAHPWLQGVMEVEMLDTSLDIPIPTKSAEDFDEAFYADGHANTLVQALFHANIATVVLARIGKVIETAVQAFAVEGELQLGDQRYVVAQGNYLAILDGADGQGIFRENPDSGFGVHYLWVDPSHPVFRTVKPMDEEIMQVIWWQLAMWIAQNQPEIYSEHTQLATRVTDIYLNLRLQNRKHTDD